MPFSARLPTVACHAATGRGRRRLPASGTESRSSVTSSPDGIRRWTGSAATVPVADGITGIDTKMVGRYLVTSAYLVEADQLALVETGPGTSSAAVKDGL